MNDERVRRIRRLCDGEELVVYQPAPSPLASEGEDPRSANVERRHRALQRHSVHRTLRRSKHVVPPPR